MKTDFIHLKNWGNRGAHETWVPVDKNGEPIPHIYGYLVSQSDSENYQKVDISESDLYELEEIQKHHIGLFSSGVTGHPTGKFHKINSSRINASIVEDTYCDMGCDDCGHAYTHFELIPDVISGCFAVPKGSKIEKLVCIKGGGSSFFPNEYKLI